MGIDYGHVRIGIALSDPLRIIAKPFRTIQNDGENVFSEINRIITEKIVGKIVLGLPITLDGNYSQKTLEVKQFGENLEKHISIPIEFWDERYTTDDANEILKKQGFGIKESKQVIDQIAASIILKNYMDNTN